VNSNQQQLWQRLEGFVAKIKQRHGELMQEAEAGCRQVMVDNPTDPIPLGNAVSAIDRRFDQLRRKMDDTWSDQIMDMFVDAETGSGGFVDRGIDYVRDAEHDMECAWARLKIKLQADYYRNLWPIAVEEMKKPVSCTNCGMELQPPVRHQSVNVTCPGCNAANQVFPHKAVYSYYGGAPHAFGEEAAIEQRVMIEKWRIQVDRDRRAQDWPDESIQSLDKWLEMEREYWNLYGQMKARLSSETPEQQQAFIDSRVKQFVEIHLANNQQWRRAKGL